MSIAPARSYDDCDCVPGHRCDCWDFRQVGDPDAVARYIHSWQALDRGHGPFTARCICNHHARAIASLAAATPAPEEAS